MSYFARIASTSHLEYSVLEYIQIQCSTQKGQNHLPVVCDVTGCFYLQFAY